MNLPMENRVSRLEGAYEQVADRLNAIDVRLGALDVKIDGRFDAFDRKVDARFGELDGKVDERFGELDRKVDERFGELDRRVGQFDVKSDRRFALLIGGVLTSSVTVILAIVGFGIEIVSRIPAR